MMSASFPSLLQSFFTDRLLRQRQASPHTIAGYRDCFRLLLQFAKERLGKMPWRLRIEDLDAPFIGLFLDHLESTRKNSARTRNARLGAIHSFFRYVALEEPAHALHCQRILAMPNKRHEQRPIDFLNREEIEALLAVPNPSTWIGRRDRTLLRQPHRAPAAGGHRRQRQEERGPRHPHRLILAAGTSEDGECHPDLARHPGGRLLTDQGRPPPRGADRRAM